MEYYELYYRPVLEDVPADGNHVPQGATHSLCPLIAYLWLNFCTDVISALSSAEVTSTVFYSVSKVNVKETHCTVTDLLPNAQYELWVTATNTTGISPASEKALYMTGKTPLGKGSTTVWVLPGII